MLSTVFETLRRASVANAQHNSRSRYPPPCDPGTRVDILAKISECVSEPGVHSICWLYGVAGSGKSAIAQSISELFAKKGKLAASFFFNREEDRRSSTEHVIATIAYQLAINIPNAKGPICEALKQDETILDTLFENQLQKLIIEPLRSLPTEPDSSWVIVIDAIDECKDVIRMAQLMAPITVPHSNGRFPIQFFITSRNEPHIRAMFMSMRGTIPTLSYDLQDFKADGDLRLFFENRLQEIRQERNHVMPGISSSWPLNNELEALVRKSSGLFIYASTVVKFIGDEHAIPDKQLEVVLSIADRPNTRIHADLDQLYKQVLSASPDLDQLKWVIGAIILLRIPLSPPELACLLSMEVAPLLLVLQPLHSIISIPPNPDAGTLKSFHLSLHDFLTSRERSGIYFIDLSLQHADLAKCCLKRIVTLPRFTYLPLSDPARCRLAVEQHLKEINSSDRIALRYACWYWSSHLSDSCAMQKELMVEMKAFCCRYTLSWSMILFDMQSNMEVVRERDWDRQRMLEGWRRAAEGEERALDGKQGTWWTDKWAVWGKFLQESVTIRMLQALIILFWLSMRLLELAGSVLTLMSFVIWTLQALVWVLLQVARLGEMVWVELGTVVRVLQRVLEVVALSMLVELAVQRGMRLLLEVMLIPAIVLLVMLLWLLWPLLWKPPPHPLPRDVKICLAQAKSWMSVSP